MVQTSHLNTYTKTVLLHKQYKPLENSFLGLFVTSLLPNNFNTRAFTLQINKLAIMGNILYDNFGA